ncbi:MAG: hypothetical protein ABIR96_07475 [Bdellovibrionota bacterium]
MKNYKLINKAFAAFMLTTLVACGGNKDNNPRVGVNDPRYSGYAQACGVSNNFGNSPYMKTIKGQDPSGATIDLLLYGDGSGNISVVGQLDIPDLSRLAIGATGSYRSCVSGSGQIEMDVTDQEIRVNLQGSNIVIQSSGPYTPIVRGDVLIGDFAFQLGGRSGTLAF